ncbi:MULTISPECIES: pyroglutamyl-peptidase I [Pantoea]|jgi:pyroglutamyl-peptidase|uniref:Pyrrolidone-carboxylate peptidase n=1 Tax=Pantoea piersonii TaxID=2364647 RepID=A0AAJ5U912_9GAMM|nr:MULTISPECIES: pyroglutamyl-peptidase I [Pantoea]MDU6432428.1 pyroglutamyl-peptidase I [Pantoea sp.]MBZ6385800.1 pyroglutamyl-peptidase I [Pantoea piersonii]MBZ6401229.1 pyroglutamyl-peptidase I [Pantoea piersonii]MBZ6409497.1 pyroglutamyl-peptidase I [Pantoea piersonii]MBZ6427923.1 pyroglutamyl-peptidase I [Pantoea piersonii]
MKTVLVTAFEPFGGESLNPSWEAVRALDGKTLGGARIVARQLPVVFSDVLGVLYAAMDEVQPDLILSVGQAGGRSDITLERIGINVDDARIPDNAGQQPVDEPIVADGPAGYFSTLPIKAIVAALREAAIPASVSQTAGTFTCNRVMYGLLHRLHTEGNRVRGGFVHIPYLPEQAAQHPGAPSMARDNVMQALEIAIRVSLETETDLKVAGGATH